MPARNDTTIVGAGPSGLVGAVVLARAGRRVTVRERHAPVGYRFHGDFRGPRNRTRDRDVPQVLAEASVAADLERHALGAGTVIDPIGRRLQMRAARPLFHLLRRGRTEGTPERVLQRRALAAGAGVRFNDRVRDVDDAGVLAAGLRQADVIAAGYWFEIDMALGVWLALGRARGPGGDAILLVQGGRATVASCVFSGFRRRAKHVTATLAIFRANAGLQMRQPRAFGSFGDTRLRATAMPGRHPAIGALAGFGLRYATRSGGLAAQCILGGGGDSARWRAGHGRWLKPGVVTRRVRDTVGEAGMKLVVGHLARWRYRAPLAEPGPRSQRWRLCPVPAR